MQEMFVSVVQHELEIVTGDVTEAGSDMDVTFTVFGAKGSSSPIKVEKSGDRFERGRSDLIKIEMEDIAPLKMMRIEVTGKGSRPTWYLEQVGRLATLSSC